MTDSNPKSYDRQPTDTPKSWAAFCCYRDLGVHRSLDKAFRFWKGLGQDSTKKVPGYFKQWSVDYDWVKRTSDFDTDEQQRRLQERQQEQRQEHNRQLDLYQQDGLIIGRNGMQVANAIIAVCGAVANDLARIAQNPGGMPREQLGKLATVASALKSAMAATETASKLRGDSLYVERIMQDYERISQLLDEHDTGKSEGT